MVYMTDITAQMVKNLPAVRETQVSSLGQEERNGNPLQYSCLENSLDKGAWQATVHGVTKELDTTEQLTLSCGVQRNVNSVLGPFQL